MLSRLVFDDGSGSLNPHVDFFARAPLHNNSLTRRVPVSVDWFTSRSGQIAYLTEAYAAARPRNCARRTKLMKPEAISNTVGLDAAALRPRAHRRDGRDIVGGVIWIPRRLNSHTSMDGLMGAAKSAMGGGEAPPHDPAEAEATINAEADKAEAAGNGDLASKLKAAASNKRSRALSWTSRVTELPLL